MVRPLCAVPLGAMLLASGTVAQSPAKIAPVYELQLARVIPNEVANANRGGKDLLVMAMTVGDAATGMTRNIFMVLTLETKVVNRLGKVVFGPAPLTGPLNVATAFKLTDPAKRDVALQIMNKYAAQISNRRSNTYATAASPVLIGPPVAAAAAEQALQLFIDEVDGTFIITPCPPQTTSPGTSWQVHRTFQFSVDQLRAAAAAARGKALGLDHVAYLVCSQPFSARVELEVGIRNTRTP